MLDKPPYCDPNVNNSNPVKGKGNCGNRTIGTMYFISFVIITFLIVVNMYIAVILENFDVATRENAEPLTADDFEQFFEVWQKFDDKLTQLISYDQLQLLLHQLDMPLKVPFPNRPFITHYEMQMTADGQIHCLEVIIALIKKVLGDSPALNAMKAAMVQTFQMKCKSTVQYEPVMTTMEYARMDRSARIIQNAWRVWYYEKGGRELRGPLKKKFENTGLNDYMLSNKNHQLKASCSAPNMVNLFLNYNQILLVFNRSYDKF